MSKFRGFRRVRPYVLCLALAAAAPAAEPVVYLWPSGAPGSEGRADPEKKVDQERISNIHQPSLTVFLPPPDKANGAAMVVAPGGGHRILAIQHEGFTVARWLNSIGVTAFVLKYRLQNEPGSVYKTDVHALADARRAIQLVRSRAAEWRVDPKRVGIMGFSAGGGLAAMASTRHVPADPNASDPLERVASRPDFQALIYPGRGSEAMVVGPDTPQAFLLCANADKGPAQAILSLYQQFKQAGVPAEVHIYASGGHGFGMRDKLAGPLVNGSWHLRLRDWMADRGLLGK